MGLRIMVVIVESCRVSAKRVRDTRGSRGRFERSRVDETKNPAVGTKAITC